MGRINIRLDDKTEMEIKRLAAEKKQTLSDYCRERILGGVSQEQPLSRASIESEIDNLRKSLDTVNRNLMNLSKKILQDTQMSSNLVQGFFNVVIEDDETKQSIYREAKAETEQYMNRLFKG